MYSISQWGKNNIRSNTAHTSSEHKRIIFTWAHVYSLTCAHHYWFSFQMRFMKLYLVSWSYSLSLHIGIIAIASIKKDHHQRISPFVPSSAYLKLPYRSLFGSTLLSLTFHPHNWKQPSLFTNGILHIHILFKVPFWGTGDILT